MSKLKVVIIAAALLVVAMTGGIFYYFNGTGAVDPGNEEPVPVLIPAGSGSSVIVEILDENGLVKDKTCAKILSRMGGYDSLQANSYVFNKGMTLSEIFDAINTGDFNYISKQKFTIIEGATIPQAAEAIAAEITTLSAKDITDKWADVDYLNSLIGEYWFITEDILQEGIMFPLEGYLYPETYFVTEAEPTIESITAAILQKTDEELTARKADIEGMGMSVHEFLSLASIVEGESLFEKDRPMIAGVMINRLEQDIALQVDISVLYALQERHIDVTFEDLEVESPYNTYKNPGLPVGPICAVPAHTMDDVINYEESDYLYFFAKEDGEVLYSKTVEEHERIVDENMWY